MTVLVPSVIWSGYQGEALTLVLLYKDAEGNLRDANDPSLTLYAESTGTVIHFTGSDMTHESTGTYTLRFALTEEGEWWANMFDGEDELGPASPFLLVVSRNLAYGR